MVFTSASTDFSVLMLGDGDFFINVCKIPQKGPMPLLGTMIKREGKRRQQHVPGEKQNALFNHDLPGTRLQIEPRIK
ncbi:MAG: hypothetical protein V4488_02600 [Pseudomonadota bacterium]